MTTQVSPLAVPFPEIAPVAGVELAVGHAGLYKQVRDDVLLMRFAQGTTCAKRIRSTSSRTCL